MTGGRTEGTGKMKTSWASRDQGKDLGGPSRCRGSQGWIYPRPLMEQIRSRLRQCPQISFPLPGWCPGAAIGHSALVPLVGLSASQEGLLAQGLVPDTNSADDFKAELECISKKITLEQGWATTTPEPNPACLLLLCCPQAKNNCNILK